MKKILLFLTSVLLVLSCNSIKEHNAHLEDAISVNDLKSDVDYAYNRLQKMHPKLYWYISKDKLDFKFDSLKNTITAPMKSFDFYQKLAPIIKTIGQGHMRVLPYVKKYTLEESKLLAKKGVGPFSQFEFEQIDNKIYVIKNKSYNKKIKVGTEVVGINNKNLSDLIANYKTLMASDGLNTTFLTRRLGKNFDGFYTNQFGVQDSLVYNLKINDSLKSVSIKRAIVDSVKLDKNKKQTKTVVDKVKVKATKKRNDVFGYNKDRKLYNRNLHFLEKDSSVAVMKINGFQIGDYEKFYENSFKRISELQSKTLIIDLRDNGGGRLSEIAKLYSYLVNEPFIFADKSEVVSKTSMLSNMDYFKGNPLYIKPLLVLSASIIYPLYFFKTHKVQDGRYYLSSKQQKVQQPSTNNFIGKIYVLINGGSFSASSLLSSNLKGSKRAFFVGEETGGGYNGTVAGQMPIEILPKSKIGVRIGLLSCIPYYKTDVIGHGIYPDKEIIPTLQDRIDGKDAEMNWVLNDAKKI